MRRRRLLKLFLTCQCFGLFLMLLNRLYTYKARFFNERSEKDVHQADFMLNRNKTLPEQQPLSSGSFSSQHACIREFTEMKFGPIFIFGVAGGNSSESKIWDHFKIYGILDNKKYGKSNMTCCLMYSLGNYTFIKPMEPLAHRKFEAPAYMWNFHVTCPNSMDNDTLLPHSIAVTADHYTCGEDHVTYVKPYFPLKEPNKIAIGTKTAYGNVDAELIIEWMEAYKYLGVDKIVTYYIKGLNKDALKVLNYYASTGILDLCFYEPANEANYPRIADFHSKHSLRWNDQATIVDDSFERMSGYRYFGIIDHDEFFIPRKHRTLKEMLNHLEKVYLNPAGFILKAQYYFLSWGKYSNDSDMILGSYTRREDTNPRQDNIKNIYIPSRVAFGGVDTHAIHSTKGYNMLHLDAEYGYVHHYRRCRSEMYTECMNETKRVFDNEVAKWSEAFRGNVRQVRRTVLGI